MNSSHFSNPNLNVNTPSQPASPSSPQAMPNAAYASTAAMPEPQNTQTAVAKPPEPETKLEIELRKFNEVAESIRRGLEPAAGYESRCAQAFDIANDLFGNAPTWTCFYRELMGSAGIIKTLFSDTEEFSQFLRSDQYHQIQLMLTALRSRDLPESDPKDPQRMITVRLPKSLHKAMCDEAKALNISVNRLCISRMLQLLDPKMIPETTSKPRGRKPREDS